MIIIRWRYRPISGIRERLLCGAQLAANRRSKGRSSAKESELICYAV